MSHLGPLLCMELRPNDYTRTRTGSTARLTRGMNDISALRLQRRTSSTSLERHEAFPEPSMSCATDRLPLRAPGRARQQPSLTPSKRLEPRGRGCPEQWCSCAFCFSNERDRYSMSGVPTFGGGQIVYPVSQAQPATATHAAVPAGSLATRPTSSPPTCCHRSATKSYRKRLKLAKQTQRALSPSRPRTAMAPEQADLRCRPWRERRGGNHSHDFEQLEHAQGGSIDRRPD